MNKFQNKLTLKQPDSLLLDFRTEWISSDIIKVSLPIQLCASFMDKLAAFGMVLPTSLAKAVSSRKYEFIAGRACVQTAMNLLGEFNVPQLAIGNYREPIWPTGFSGSISHSFTHAIALVARGNIKLGVDLQEYLSAELAKSLKYDILLSNEFQFSRFFPSYEKFFTTVFSAKESLFKCMFRDIKRYVDFSVAELAYVDRDGSKLILRLQEDLSTYFFKGREVTVKFNLGVHQVETFII